MKHRLLLTPLLATVLSTAALAQTVGGDFAIFHEWKGNDEHIRFGSVVANAGDVNADGHDDVIVGAPEAQGNGKDGSGTAYVYSGKSGEVLYLWHGMKNFDHFGYAVCGAGDLNNDGHSDVMVGSRDADFQGLNASGAVYVYSGESGSLMFTLGGENGGDRFGSAISFAGDVNQDGVDDILVGSPGYDSFSYSDNGAVGLYSGSDGSLIWQRTGIGDYSAYGAAVGSLGDTNFDGIPDVMVAAPYADPGGITNAGSVYVYSGSSGLLLRAWNGHYADDSFGTSISDAGDINQDGASDVIIGAPDENARGIADCGSFTVYSGADGSQMLRRFGDGVIRHFGQSVAGAGDLNHDGYADLFIGASHTSLYGNVAPGAAYLHSGKDGTLLKKWDGAENLDSFGWSVAGGCDVNGDGTDDLLVGAPQQSNLGNLEAGRVQACGFSPFLNSTAETISASSTSILGLELRFPPQAANYQYRILISSTGIGPLHYNIDIPLTLDDMVLQSYFGNYFFPIHSGMHGTLNANAEASASIGVAAGSANYLVGHTFWLAAVSNSAGLLPEFSSIAVAITID
ncbi:MAG: FG-GAP repeat protein [Planctomycetes bacterium]|nr:FG-GAP repeat protein [Planctomycetota bacterium]